MLNVSPQREVVPGKLGSSREACETQHESCTHVLSVVSTRLLVALHEAISLISGENNHPVQNSKVLVFKENIS